jgi:hypothetical protein
VSTTTQERAGVIVIRVWIEDASSAQLRARITASEDLSSVEQTVGAAEGVDGILAAVSDWLDGFLAR